MCLYVSSYDVWGHFHDLDDRLEWDLRPVVQVFDDSFVVGLEAVVRLSNFRQEEAWIQRTSVPSEHISAAQDFAFRPAHLEAARS